MGTPPVYREVCHGACRRREAGEAAAPPPNAGLPPSEMTGLENGRYSPSDRITPILDSMHMCFLKTEAHRAPLSEDAARKLELDAEEEEKNSASDDLHRLRGERWCKRGGPCQLRVCLQESKPAGALCRRRLDGARAVRHVRRKDHCLAAP